MRELPDDQPIRSLTASGEQLFLGSPFTPREAERLGVTRKRLRRLAREGVVRPLLQGVYVDASVHETLDVRALAAAKVIPRGSVVCDRTAAWVHGLSLLGPDGRVAVPPVDVYRLAGAARVRRAQCSGGTRTFAWTVDVMKVRDIVVTTPLRTALDLGRLLRRREAMAALDGLLRVGDLTVEDLRVELPRFRGARGVVQLRSLVPLADPRAESPAESISRLLLLDSGLPAPEVQWAVFNGAGILIYRLDLAYPALLLAIEYDGIEFHSSDEDRARDAERRAYLRSLGWTFVILKTPDVYGSDPTAARRVAAILNSLHAAA